MHLACMVNTIEELVSVGLASQLDSQLMHRNQEIAIDGGN
jgi:hypothetical protein